MGTHFKEDGTLNLNKYKLSMLLRQFCFYKAPNMEKCPKLTFEKCPKLGFKQYIFWQNLLSFKICFIILKKTFNFV